jgi:hypothetical protein
LRRIAEARDRINSKKQELAVVKAQSSDEAKREGDRIAAEIKELKGSNAELVQNNKKLEE